MKIQGTGPTLREACPWLREDAQRHAIILEIVERNSVIEGLPPFNNETRRQILERLQSLSANRQIAAHAEPLPSPMVIRSEP